MIRDILLLGNEDLYQTSREVSPEELAKARQVAQDLQDTMLKFRSQYGFGRAIAAPQIGEFLRIIYMNLGNVTYTFINPRLEFGPETFELWDDCMSFPGLEVRLLRYAKTKITYKDLDWQDCTLEFSGDLSELIQHEYDHLDGILAVQRAIDNKSLRVNKEKAGCY